MDLLAVLFCVLILWKMDFSGKTFREDGLSPENTKSLKGILAVFVMLHHLYREIQGGFLLFFFDNVGILCVSLFLFLSGYGLQKSYEKKPGYRKKILTRRIPAVAVPYLCLTVIYWLFSGITGDLLTPGEVLRSFADGDPVVTYSWYIVCILVFYFGYWLSVSLWKENRTGILCTNFLLSILWVLLCRALGFGGYWYNAAALFPAGIFWAVCEDRAVPFLRKRYLLLLAGSAMAFGVLFAGALYVDQFRVCVPLYWSGCCCFTLLVLILLMKFRFRNPVLAFLGSISFEIYGIHGLFMALYRSPAIRLEGDVVWAGAVMVSAVAAAWGLNRFFKLLLKKLLP